VRSLLILMLSLGLGCRAVPADLPVQERTAELDSLDSESAPPLYQFMYDSAFLPEVQATEQRARILVWLRYVDLETYQLRMLLGLHERAGVLRERLEASQQRIVLRHEPSLAPIYDGIYELLASGAPLDDPRLGQLAERLREARVQALRDDELLAIRMQSVRALLDEEQELLRTLSPQQEARFPDMVFALRRQLDMASTAGDFRVLVGSLYSVGDPTLLLRGDFEATREHLDIGGLWADDAKAELSGPVLHQARRELLLYLLLQEPALPEAVRAAQRARGDDPDLAAPAPELRGAAPGAEDGVRPPPGAQVPPGMEPPPDGS
jgi:hypothetical protein